MVKLILEVPLKIFEKEKEILHHLHKEGGKDSKGGDSAVPKTS